MKREKNRVKWVEKEGDRYRKKSREKGGGGEEKQKNKRLKGCKRVREAAGALGKPAIKQRLCNSNCFLLMQWNGIFRLCVERQRCFFLAIVLA